VSSLGLVLLGLTAVVLPATGLPAFAVLLAMAVLGAAIGVGTGSIDVALLGALPSRLVNLLESDLLQALPLYILIGGLLDRLPVADALFRSIVRLVRGSPAGPAVAAVSLGALLGPMNGSVGATVVALSKSVEPHLAESRMPAPSRHALIAVASTLGIVVPPSLVLILLGDAMMSAHTIALRTSGRADRILNTGDVFRSALVPAGLFVVACAAVAAFGARKSPAAPPQPAASPWRDALVAAVAVAFVGGLLAGVAAGYFYAVEGAAAGAFVLFLAALFAGGLRGGRLHALLADTMATAGALFALLVAATTFTLVFRALGTDRLLDAWIGALPGGPHGATLVVLGVIGASALALDAFEIIFVLVPMLIPPLLARVPDASWVAVLVLLALQASFLLPPIGYALLMTRGVLRQRVPARAVALQLVPYLAAQLVLFACVFVFPGLTHLGQVDSVAAPAAAAPEVSDEEMSRRLREMIPPPPEDNEAK
jgi:tripartite ATP-independent transporter DctM subunit